MNEKDYTRNITVNGADIHLEYHEHSTSKETFVLLHGFLSSTFSFRRLIPILKEHYNVLSIDLPPFGKSGKNKGFYYSYDNLAQTVIDVLKHLNIKNVYLSGHSMGGQIALNVMKKDPSLVKKGILLCSSGYMKKLPMHMTLFSYIPYFHLIVKLWLTRSGVRNNLENVVHDKNIIDDEMLIGYLKPFVTDDEIFKALTKMIRHREGDLSPRELKDIQTPCLLIWGKHDRVVPLHIGKRLHKDLPNSKLEILEDGGHLVPEELPYLVFDKIEEFIESQVEGSLDCSMANNVYNKGLAQSIIKS